MCSVYTMSSRCYFPLEFQKVLIGKETDYRRLSNSMAKRGYRLSFQYIAAAAIGTERMTPFQLRRICETLQLDERERRRLHKAAALDYGFELGVLDG